MGVTPNDRSILQLTLGFTPLSCPLGVPYAATHHGGGGGASIMIPGSTLLARISLVLTHGTPRL